MSGMPVGGIGIDPRGKFFVRPAIPEIDAILFSRSENVVPVRAPGNIQVSGVALTSYLELFDPIACFSVPKINL